MQQVFVSAILLKTIDQDFQEIGRAFSGRVLESTFPKTKNS
jgi:hypothetical protein